MIYDDGTGSLEVGSISEMTRHTKHNAVYWHWGVDTMPLMDHGGWVPSPTPAARSAAGGYAGIQIHRARRGAF